MSGEREQIKEYELESFRRSEVYPLFPLLRNGIFHRTSIAGYRGIKQKGYIEPNRGQFDYSYPQSKVYYGPTQGYVCLFDFASAAEEDCVSIHRTWGQFFYDHQPATIALRLNRLALGADLIPNTAAPKLGSYKSYIPYVEAWYPKPVPTSAIESYLFVMDVVCSEGLIFQEFSREQTEEFEALLDFIEQEWQKALRRVGKG